MTDIILTLMLNHTDAMYNPLGYFDEFTNLKAYKIAAKTKQNISQIIKPHLECGISWGLVTIRTIIPF